MLRKTPLLFAAMLSCGNPDNVVVGGISATSTIPVAIIQSIQSAEAGITTYIDPQGNHIQLSVVAFTDHPGLCQKLKDHPDYFRNPIEPYVALLLYAPVDRIGTFVTGRDPGAEAEVIATTGPSTDGGVTAATQPYFA